MQESENPEKIIIIICCCFQVFSFERGRFHELLGNKGKKEGIKKSDVISDWDNFNVVPLKKH